MDKAAIRQAVKVMGISLAKPPSLSRLVVPVLCCTEPPVKKRQLLYMALFNIWKSPPAIPIGFPVPIPKTIYPT